MHVCCMHSTTEACHKELPWSAPWQFQLEEFNLVLLNQSQKMRLTRSRASNNEIFATGDSDGTLRDAVRPQFFDCHLSHMLIFRCGRSRIAINCRHAADTISRNGPSKYARSMLRKRTRRHVLSARLTLNAAIRALEGGNIDVLAAIRAVA